MEGLKALLEAPSKKAVQDAFVLAFQTRKDEINQTHVSSIHGLLGVKGEVAEEVLDFSD